jgi:hypothetical protein
MFGCFRRLGCLVVLLILAIVAWFNRDKLEAIYRRYAGGEPPAADSSPVLAARGGWEPLSEGKAARGRSAVQSLSLAHGPQYVDLTASEAASYIFLEVAKQLPASSTGIMSSIKDDRLYVRADVNLKEIGGAGVLGTLGALLSNRDTVQLGGTINVLKPGSGEFEVKAVRIGAFPIPDPIIPRLISRMRKGKMPPGIADDAFPMKLPEFIGNVRIADGKITVYKTQPK